MCVCVLRQRGRADLSYLRVELVDLLDRRLNITRMNRSTNVNSFLDGLAICLGLYVGLYGEFLRSSRIAVGDEVVHD